MGVERRYSKKTLSSVRRWRRETGDDAVVVVKEIRTVSRHELSVSVPDHQPAGGKSIPLTVLVDWFPPLTAAELIENGTAIENGDAVPHPNPNIIYVNVTLRRHAESR